MARLDTTQLIAESRLAVKRAHEAQERMKEAVELARARLLDAEKARGGMARGHVDTPLVTRPRKGYGEVLDE